MNDSSLVGRIALMLLLLLAGAAHAIHLGNPDRGQLRLLDGCLVGVAVVVCAWVVSNRGDRRRAATGGFVAVLVLFAAGVFGF